MRADELPAGWGLLELCGDRMMTRAHAAVRAGVTTLPREVAARFIGRLAQRNAQAEKEERDRERTSIMTEARRAITAELTRGIEAERDEATRVRAEHNELLAALGVRRGEWNAHEKALRAARVFADAELSGRPVHGRLVRLADELADHVTALRTAATALTGETPP